MKRRRPTPSLVRTLADLNRTAHEPARLAILTVLEGCQQADFTFLESATGLTKGNLSVQLTRLEEAALICLEKTAKGNRTITTRALLPKATTSLNATGGTWKKFGMANRPLLQAGQLDTSTG